MNRGLVLIASFPKSGNTWTRIVLEKLWQGPDKAFSINGIDTIGFGSFPRALFDAYAPVDAADLSWSEIEDIFPDVCRRLSGDNRDRVYLKIHDKLRKNARGEWQYPAECVHAALYLARHPFDVAVSYAHHLGASLERTVAIMGADSSIPAPRRQQPIDLSSPPYSWSDTVNTWLDAPYTTEVARYEDMHANPHSVFLRLAITAGFDVGPKEVEMALEATRFDLLQREEAEHGFLERPKSATAPFFRVGRPGTWQGVLSESLQAQIVRDHSAAMERLGYMPDGSVVAMPG